jgi:hypothetical protein
LGLGEATSAAKNLRGPLARLGKPIRPEQGEDSGIRSVWRFGFVGRGIAVRRKE